MDASSSRKGLGENPTTIRQFIIPAEVFQWRSDVSGWIAGVRLVTEEFRPLKIPRLNVEFR